MVSIDLEKAFDSKEDWLWLGRLDITNVIQD